MDTPAGAPSDFTKQCLAEYKQYIAHKKEEGHLCIISLDFSSLYPSLIMTYNLSPEFMIQSKEEADLYRQQYPVHDVEFDFNYEDYVGEKHCRPVRGWSIRHAQDPTTPRTDDRFGLYPSILLDLFNQRANIKKELAVLEHRQEHLEKELDKTALREHAEYRQLCLRLKYVDTKQKALKVFMNTFYGECGNKNSPLFVLELAGGITSAGQANLKKVKRFIEGQHCRVFYGDTDSLYFSMDPALFHDEHRAYFCGHLDKHRYSTALVEATFRHIKGLNAQVNSHLKQDNGTGYLKMAYEEVLYPAAFLARKKYYGIAHKGLVNFKPKDIFIRGFEVKKRGVSEILRILCMGTMWESMDVLNCKTLMQLVEEKISHMFNSEWSMRDFVATAMWKPEKLNVPVNMFQQRMLDENRTPVEAYERFEYVLCKITDPAKLFDYRGCKIEIKKGHLMEYLDVAQAEGRTVDIQYYFEKQLVGQFARLISYDDRFVVDTLGDELDDSVLDKDKDVDDDATMKNARKYVMGISKQYFTDFTQYSSAYKTVYRTINKGYAHSLQVAAKEFGGLCMPCPDSETVKEAIENRLAQHAEQHQDKWKQQADTLLRAMTRALSPTEITMAYNAGNRSQFSLAKKALQEQRLALVQSICQTAADGDVDWLFKTNEDKVRQITAKYREQILDKSFGKAGTEGEIAALAVEEIAAMFARDDCPVITEGHRQALTDIKSKWNRLAAIQQTLYQQDAIHQMHYAKKIKAIPKFKL